METKLSAKQIAILEVAEELIAQRGFNGTSVRDICNKAKVNVAMISYYFGSKEKMMGSLYQLRVSKTRQNFAEFSEIIKSGNPEMQMKEIIKFRHFKQERLASFQVFQIFYILKDSI